MFLRKLAPRWYKILAQTWRNSEHNCSLLQAAGIAKKLFREEGCGAYKLFLMPWVQLPLWVILSYSLRNMTGFFSELYPPFCPTSPTSMAGEGALWFSDLTVCDSYMILPVVLAATNLLNIEVQQNCFQACPSFILCVKLCSLVPVLEVAD